MGTTVKEAAGIVRAERTTTAQALAEQEAAEYRDAFAVLGLDISDERTAIGAFATAQILLWHLTEACGDPTTALQVVGKSITTAVIALAEFIT